MNTYHPRTVFSSIDTQGRYAFGNQPNIAYWNLRIFANALLPLIDEEEERAKSKAEAVLNQFPEDFSTAYFKMMGKKLGIVNQVEDDRGLVLECIELLTERKVDYTNFFTELRRGGDLIEKLRQEEDFEIWYSKWEKVRLRDASLAESNALMAQTNPVVIPRNHLVEDVLKSAVSGDMKPFHGFMKDLATPYDDELPEQAVPANFDASYQTFCGT